MKIATIVGAGINNDLFNIESQGNRDDYFFPYRLLKKKLRSLNVDLITSDTDTNNKSILEIHINAKTLPPRNKKIFYLLNFETPLIDCANSDPTLLEKYDRIFSWANLSPHKLEYIKINFPNKFIIPTMTNWGDRPKFSCIISGNKTTISPDPRELYSERIKTTRWFERHAPKDFDLFGTGWDMPPMRYGKIGRAMARLQGRAGKIIGIKFFPSYRGKVISKLETLQKFKYSFCYENATGYDGYITEKIFDCFFAGCVPIYWGAPDITTHIPADCFIDRTQFKSHEEMYRHLKTISEQEYIQYQKNIISFLKSETAYPFSAEYFADVIANKIAADLGLNH